MTDKLLFPQFRQDALIHGETLLFGGKVPAFTSLW